MSVEINIEINAGDIINKLETAADGMEDIINEIIHDWVIDLKAFALITKPWRDRTGNLRAGHIIRPTEDGWELVVDARLGGIKDTDINYGWILEYGDYPWLRPAVVALEPELEEAAKRALKDLIEKNIRKQTITIQGKEKTIYRYSAGTIIGGEAVGGRFTGAPK